MAFITHCWRNFPRPETLLLSGILRARQACVWTALALSLGLPSWAHADTSVELQNFKLERQDASLYMSANWRFDLPATLEDALLKGITLYFVTEVEINQERWYVYNQRLAQAERHVRLF